MDNKKFNIEYLYGQYLKRMNLNEKEMHAYQKQETKRAFMGGMGQMLVTLLDEVQSLDEEHALKALDDILNQVNDFFKKECQKSN